MNNTPVFITIENNRYRLNKKQITAFSNLLEHNKKVDKKFKKYLKKQEKKSIPNHELESFKNKIFDKQNSLDGTKKLFKFSIDKNNNTILKITNSYDWRNEENPIIIT